MVKDYQGRKGALNMSDPGTGSAQFDPWHQTHKTFQPLRTA